MTYFFVVVVVEKLAVKIDVKLSLTGYIGVNADYQHLVGCWYSQQDCAPNQK